MIDRRVRKIAHARSLTVGLATTFLLLAFVGAVVIRIVDHKDFPTIGLAVWWSLQTVTTVGYGDIVPHTAIGRVVGGAELVIGVSFVAFLTAGVTSSVIRREGARGSQSIVEALQDTTTAIAHLEARLDGIESKLRD
jgi:voltage-gated potassium channel